MRKALAHVTVLAFWDKPDELFVNLGDQALPLGMTSISAFSDDAFLRL
jgi:hypothetical protein